MTSTTTEAQRLGAMVLEAKRRARAKLGVPEGSLGEITEWQLAWAAELVALASPAKVEPQEALQQLTEFGEEHGLYEEAAPIKTLTPEQINATAHLIVGQMPDGIQGFLKTWGWQQFANELFRVLHGWQPAKVEPAEGWVSVENRLPEDGQSVAFVVACKNQSYDYLDGKVLGGDYRASPFGGFGVPGLTIGASHWMPLPVAPPEAAQAKEACHWKGCPHGSDCVHAKERKE